MSHCNILTFYAVVATFTAMPVGQIFVTIPHHSIRLDPIRSRLEAFEIKLILGSSLSTQGMVNMVHVYLW